MQHKKNAKQIGSYYEKKDVVETYNRRRFAGKGGSYISRQEIEPALELLSDTLEPNAFVLDVGAGRGRLSLPLKKKGFTVFCLDLSTEMLTYLSKYIPKQRLINQSVFEPIKSKNKFDAITGLRFFDHFTYDDQLKIIKNLKKKLKKNGSMVVIALNKHSLESAISGLFPYGRYNYFYSDQEYNRLFKKAGFKVIARQSSIFIPRGLFLKLSRYSAVISLLTVIDQLLKKTFPQLCAVYYYRISL